MNQTESLFFRILDIFSRFVLLNALWIICSLPIITFFPATSALFSVARKWLIEGMGVGTVRVFFSSFKDNFVKSFVIGLFCFLAGVILIIDFILIMQVNFTGDFFVFILIILAIIIYIFTSIYVFFIIAHYNLSIIQTIKNALLLSISYLIQTILCVIIIGVVVVILYYFPVFIFVFGSLIAFILYYIFQNLPLVKEG